MLVFTPLVQVDAKITPDCGTFVTVLNTDGTPKFKKDSAGNDTTEELKKIEKPCGFPEAMLLVKNIIEFLLFVIATPLAALIISYAGFLMITAGGNSEKVTKAKSIIKNIVFGYIVALAAWIIVSTIFSTLGVNKCVNWLNKTIPDCKVNPK